MFYPFCQVFLRKKSLKNSELFSRKDAKLPKLFSFSPVFFRRAPGLPKTLTIF